MAISVLFCNVLWYHKVIRGRIQVKWKLSLKIGFRQCTGWCSIEKAICLGSKKSTYKLIFSAQSTNHWQPRVLFPIAIWPAPALSLPRSHFSSFWVDKFTQACLSSSDPADRETEANTCSPVFGLWSRYFPQYVDLARTTALSESKTSSHNTGIPQLFQPSTNQKQTLACLFLEFEVDIYEDRCLFSWPFSQPQCLLRRSHQSWGKRCMISLFFVLIAANYTGL